MQDWQRVTTRRRNRGIGRAAFDVALIAVVGPALADMAQAGGLYVGEYPANSMGTAGAGGAAPALDAGTLIHDPARMSWLEGCQAWGGCTLGVGFIESDETDSAANANEGSRGGGQPRSLARQGLCPQNDLLLAQTLRYSAYWEATEEIAPLFSAG